MFSFTARKKSVDFQRYIRRIIDLTIPNKGPAASVERFESRHNRAIPALLCPWKNNEPDMARCAVVITKDISDQGVGLILTRPFEAEQVVLGFHLEGTANEPWFFRGAPEHSIAIGGGFWLLGVGLTEFMNETWRSELEPLVEKAKELVPSA